jgi:hypothetical protein
MFGMRIKRAFMAGVLGLGLTVLGSSVASAASVPMVFSDGAAFAGPAALNSAGTYTFNSRRCTLRSDLEATVQCKLSATFSVSTTGGSGSATLTSADGVTTWNFALTPTSTPNVFVMNGQGNEADSPENGVPSPQYAASMRGRLKLTPTPPGFFVTGNVVVSETPNQP